MTKAVEVEALSFSYGSTKILNNVSFSIDAGEFVGFIGPNGGGKTTLLKIILGFLKPDAGRVLIFGKSPQESSKRLAYVPQTFAFDKQFPLSVLELVLMGRLSHLPWYGSYRNIDKEAAMNALRRVSLEDVWNRPFGTLSSGQAQRALIARALVSEPELLLLDEPTASVDIESESDIQSTIKSLQNEITLLMVTHDLHTIIHDVKRILCVQGSVRSLNSEQVCEHFAMGLYHPPMIKENT